MTGGFWFQAIDSAQFGIARCGFPVPALQPHRGGAGGLAVRRLTSSGVDCSVQVVQGAFHAFDAHAFDALFPNADVSRDFWREQAKALDRAWGP